MSWFHILKKPYEIENRFPYERATTWDGEPMVDDDGKPVYMEQIFTSPYKELFQGVQGNETTPYWTYDFDEAVEYAFLGSEIGATFRDESLPKFKNKGRPKVIHAKPTRKRYTLEQDEEYGTESGRGKEGLSMEEDPDWDGINRSIDDKDKQQVPRNKVMESAIELLRDEREFVTRLRRRDEEEAKQHIHSMLKEHFQAIVEYKGKSQ